MERVNRQRFLKRAGAATGAAAFVGVPGIGKAVTDDRAREGRREAGPRHEGAGARRTCVTSSGVRSRSSPGRTR